ncbi:MAG: 50S ribosomal protein L17 [bacterium]|nr:50S ribosomal protein L17 [bacterium]
MRHHNTTRKFGRKKNQRVALMSSLALNLIVREKMKTTEAKAKELRPYIEKLVTTAKKNTLSARRLTIAKLANRDKEVKKLFDVITPRYIDRKGGYTRILKLNPRKSDGAKMAYIEFV